MNTVKVLESIASKKKGGAEAIKGFIYQIKFSVFKILSEFVGDNINQKSFQFEGIEDLDFYISSETLENTHFQAKCYDKGIDIEDFKKVLINFWDVYIQVPTSKFFLIYPSFLKGDKLKQLSMQQFQSDIDYWTEKLEEKEKNTQNHDIENFLSKIQFERCKENDLDKSITNLLLTNYNITNNNENQYLNALYMNAFLWSRQRDKIDYTNLIKVIEDTRLDISRGVINSAIKEKWIEKISFEIPQSKNIDDYFEGKAAKPYHIASDLPIKREKWENEIQSAIKQFNITIIQSSSGQGKSTLAWQVAHTLKETYSIYELFYCKDTQNIGNLKDFIISRLKIGELPLIVIDGLNTDVSSWNELARRTSELPVKYLITSREEDWFRFGRESSDLDLRNITIYLDYNEADKIFKAFYRKGKITLDIPKENAWELIKDKKLLIEYVYLLTQGKMINERLQEQLKLLNKDIDGREKTEILRLVSTADICGVKLKTRNLIELIKHEVSFKVDQNETLKSLKNEYQIHIENNYYIEGLHPVRSQHLFDILHDSTPISPTLINLLRILESEYLSQYISKAVLLIKDKVERKDFLEELASITSDKSYLEKVEIIHGIYANDAYRHWLENKDAYDEVFEGNGGLIYALDMIPFGEPIFRPFHKRNLENNDISKVMANQDVLLKYDKFKLFDLASSTIFLFVSHLYQKLQNSTIKTNLSGLGHLSRWLKRCDLECPILSQIDPSIFSKLLNQWKIEELGDLLLAIYLIYSSKYQSLLDSYRVDLICKIKAELDIPIFEVFDNQINIQYLVDEIPAPNKNITKQSVDRLTVIYRCLPNYEKYSSQGIYSPTPFIDYFRVHDESKKNMTIETLKFDEFIVKGNQTWLQQIEDNYAFSSIYDFQKYYFDLRAESVKLLKYLCVSFEHIFKGKKGKVHTSSDKSIAKVKEQLTKKLSIKYNETFSRERFEESIKNIGKWSSSLSNVVYQLLPDDDEKRRIFNINVQELRRSLPIMQLSHAFIAKSTQVYFNTEFLEKDEIQSYVYFAKIIDFYYHNSQNLRRIENLKGEIHRYLQEKEKNRINSIRKVLKKVEKDLSLEFIYPTQTLERDSLRETSIGIVNISMQDFLNEQNLIFFIMNILEAIYMDVDYYNIVFVKNYIVSNYNKGLRVSKSFLESVKNSLENGTDIHEGFSRLFPIEITSDILIPLPNLILEPIDQSRADHSPLLESLIQLWKYSFIKEKLDKIELQSIEWEQRLSNYLNLAKQNLEKMPSRELSNIFDELVLKISSGEILLDDELYTKYCVDYIFNLSEI